MNLNSGKNTTKIYLAPMEGVVDWVMRELLSDVGGFDQMVTEFVRVTTRLLPPKVFYRYCPELKEGGKTQKGVPVFVQLLGSDTGALAENAALAVELGAPGIDINFGCPAKTVNKNDGGSVILKDPKRLGPIISAIRGAVPSHVPVTAKIRLGYEHKDFTREIAEEVCMAGASRLTIHARTKVDGYRPPAYWEYIGAMREICEKHGLEVVANGDIWTVEDYLRCREVTGCSAFALGRPVIANPFLANEIRSMNSNLECSTHRVSWNEFKNLWLKRFILDSANYRHQDYAAARTKQWLKQLKRTYLEAEEEFENVKRLKDIDEMMSILIPSSSTLHHKKLPNYSAPHNPLTFDTPSPN